MTKPQIEMKRAADAGYWQLFRFNPKLAGTDKNPFTLDSKEPAADYREFLLSETRYAGLQKINPEAAKTLFVKNQSDAFAKNDKNGAIGSPA
ncbi:MAG: hypothetical protein LBC13_01345 [Clostridiales bacterium]|jgi:pyruvate-ferredoxin/flavodoxin oxidoreductase|nr:hypothetical protein [Clostridiales bacterium]